VEDAGRIRVRREQVRELSTKALVDLHRGMSSPYSWTVRSFLPDPVVRGKREAAPAQRRMLEAVVAAALLIGEHDDDPRTLLDWEEGPEFALEIPDPVMWAPHMAATDVSALLEAAARFDPGRFRHVLEALTAAKKVAHRSLWGPRGERFSASMLPKPVVDDVLALWPARGTKRESSL
jgi:hypothetical protein